MPSPTSAYSSLPRSTYYDAPRVKADDAEIVATITAICNEFEAGLARALLLKHLKERGLKGVRLIISDACIGLAKDAPGSAVAAYLRVRRRSSIFQ
jgi:hypothetical protein